MDKLFQQDNAPQGLLSRRNRHTFAGLGVDEIDSRVKLLPKRYWAMCAQTTRVAPVFGAMPQILLNIPHESPLWLHHARSPHRRVLSAPRPVVGSNNCSTILYNVLHSKKRIIIILDACQ
jgi:hypothetical protein